MGSAVESACVRVHELKREGTKKYEGACFSVDTRKKKN